LEAHSGLRFAPGRLSDRISIVLNTRLGGGMCRSTPESLIGPDAATNPIAMPHVFLSRHGVIWHSKRQFPNPHAITHFWRIRRFVHFALVDFYDGKRLFQAFLSPQACDLLCPLSILCLDHQIADWLARLRDELEGDHLRNRYHGVVSDGQLPLKQGSVFRSRIKRT
jgi:hypothetical protein